MGYRFIRFPEGKTKAVTFSYDDGSLSDLRFADMLDRYSMKGTFNINSCYVGTEGKLTVDMMKNLMARGHEIALHGAFHLAPGKVSHLEGIKDTLSCRLELEALLGETIRGMAYPDSGIRDFQNGADLDGIKRYLSDLGVVYSRTLGGDNDGFRLPDSWLEWMPTAHHDNPSILDWADKFNALDLNTGYVSSRSSRLFYVWGHTGEFNVKNNWEHMEELCQRLAGKADTWYATNIEIYEYCEAYSRLVWSANGKRVFNPTLKTIYFAEGANSYCVHSGEAVILK